MDNFVCPHCGAKLVMYEHYIDDYNGKTITMTEHYECQECYGEIEKGERIVTYTVQSEYWH